MSRVRRTSETVRGNQSRPTSRATTPVEGDDPPKRKETGAEAKKASALAFFSTVGPPELLKDIG